MTKYLQINFNYKFSFNVYIIILYVDVFIFYIAYSPPLPVYSVRECMCARTILRNDPIHSIIDWVQRYCRHRRHPHWRWCASYNASSSPSLFKTKLLHIHLYTRLFFICSYTLLLPLLRHFIFLLFCARLLAIGGHRTAKYIGMPSFFARSSYCKLFLKNSTEEQKKKTKKHEHTQKRNLTKDKSHDTCNIYYLVCWLPFRKLTWSVPPSSDIHAIDNTYSYIMSALA